MRDIPITLGLLCYGQAPAWIALGRATPELHALIAMGADMEDALAECRRTLEAFWEYAETDRALGGL